MTKKTILVSCLAASLLIGCKKDEPKLQLSVEPSEVTLFRDGTAKMNIKNAEGEIAYKSEDEYIAKVSNDGTITGKIIGQTKVNATALNGSVSTNVTINPKIKFIPEPYILFNSSLETVKAELAKQGDEYTMSNGNIVVLKTIDNSKVIYLYSFENNKLVSSGFATSITSQLASSITDFYLERDVVASQTGSYSFLGFTPDKKTAVGISISSDSSLIMVIYVPYNSQKSTKQQAIKMFEKIIEN